VLAGADLAAAAVLASDDGGLSAARRVLIDLLEDCLRHNGHADLLREAFDGLVGKRSAGSP
jgi:hypothetical protein